MHAELMHAEVEKDLDWEGDGGFGGPWEEA